MHFPFPAPMFLYLFLFMFIFHAPITLCADDDRYLHCKKSYNCSDISITYPFWGQIGPEYCGHSGFELDDCEAEAPLIDISQSTYRVLSINTSAKALTVARNDYWNDYCPTALVNSTIDFSLFNYVNTTNITLYYDCPPYTLPGSPNQINCNINGTNMIGYYATQDLTDTWEPLKKILDACTYAVLVPLYQSAANAIVDNSTTSLTDALNAGFGLTYTANNSLCEGCVQSGGYCGQNETSSKFLCYCSDGAHFSKCGEGVGEKSGEQPQKRSSALMIGLVIAAVAVVAISAGLIFFLIRRRSKQVVSQTMYKDIASSPSSKSFPSPSGKSYPTTTATSYFQSTPSYTISKSDLETGSAYFGVRLFSMSEMEEATYNFHSSREIGDGGFGVVYYGKLRDGCEVAIKRLYQKSFKHVGQFMNEVEIVARLRHPNLVTLYGCTSRHSRDLLLVYEYIPNGTVSSHLHDNGSNTSLLTWPTRLSIAIETADALAYLHSLDVIHRDVKTNNILLDNDFHTKVADFGLSRLFPADVTHVSTAPQGTPGYVDPEYYKTYQLTTKSDVYSFGVVLIELISSQEAVDTKRHEEDINLSTMAITKIQDGTLHEMVDPSLGFERDANIKRMITLVAGLALQCLQPERATRPTMQEVLQELKRIKNEGFSTETTIVVDNANDGLGF